ncbi:MAG: flagellar brake protein [Thioalkalispiraceae bacterium]|jgi:c-di-GMP-binding flagellar brake protein YcgR
MSQYESQDDIVEYPPQILGLLNRVRDTHLLLSVRLENDKQLYSSAIIDTYPEQNSMLLDELYPKTGHDKIVAGMLLQVQTRLKGVDMQFECRVNSIESSSDIAAYRVNIPDSLAYYQRRQQFRAPISQQADIYLRLQPQGSKAVIGQIFDVSLNGIGLHFDPTAGLVLEEKQTISDVKIDFPDCSPFSASLEIRSMRLNKAGNTLIVGTQFIKLPQKDQRQVQRYVAALDRQARQNRR